MAPFSFFINKSFVVLAVGRALTATWKRLGAPGFKTVGWWGRSRRCVAQTWSCPLAKEASDVEKETKRDGNFPLLRHICHGRQPEEQEGLGVKGQGALSRIPPCRPTLKSRAEATRCQASIWFSEGSAGFLRGKIICSLVGFGV